MDNKSEDTDFCIHRDIYNSYKKDKYLSRSWYNKSTDLKRSAELIWESTQKESYLINPYRMLCGLSLELIYKAIIVANGQEPDFKHDLLDLASDAGVGVPSSQIGVLKVLTNSILWNGRYPVPKTEAWYEEQYSLVRKHLVDDVTLGNSTLRVLAPNKALDFDSFLGIWESAAYVYGPCSKKEQRVIYGLDS